MAEKTLNGRIRQKIDTSANWTANNPVLLDGELIIARTNAGETRIKVGDGTSTYTQLPFIDETAGSSSPITQLYEGTLPTSGWASYSGQYYYQINISGMTADKVPLVTPQWSTAKTSEQNAWNTLTGVETFAGYVRFYASAAFSTAVNFSMYY